jgi:hypothetical protein
MLEIMTIKPRPHFIFQNDSKFVRNLFAGIVQVAKCSLILGKWMRCEIVGSSGERPTVNKAVRGFSVFLTSRISHSICASQVSSYVLRCIRNLWLQNFKFKFKIHTIGNAICVTLHIMLP